MVSFSTEAVYRSRNPEQTIVHQVVRDHVEDFLEQTRSMFDDGFAVPQFVEDEFRKFLGCGHLGGGFARLQCQSCKHEHLIPFS